MKDIDELKDHEINEGNKLVNSAFKEDEDQGKKDDDAAADERDIINLQQLIGRITELLEETYTALDACRPYGSEASFDDSQC